MELAKKFYPVEQVFPFLEEFKKHQDVLLAELKAILGPNWMPWPEQHLYERDDQWDVFPFYGFGREVPQTIEACPETYKLLKTIPNLTTAIYSRLGPKTKIHPHRGPAHLSNHILRCHLGLIVPEGCGLWVEGETRESKVGEWIVFDDSLSHSGFNNSEEERIVLLVDILRPPGVPKGTAPEMPHKDEKGLPDNWGVPEDFLGRDYGRS